MSLNQTMIVALYTLAVFSSFHVGNAEGIRLCGRRLADILNYICEKHGGFHVPRIKRDDILNYICEKHGGFHVPRIKRDVSESSKNENLQPVGTIIQSLVKRSEPGAAPSELSGMFSHQGGVVDECCKKQCTLGTLVSYCANSRDIGSINLHEIFPSETGNMPIISEEAISVLPQVPSSNLGSSEVHQFPHFRRIAHNSRPNLGLSNRDRSVFIVLSQLQEDEDKALGEYRF